MIQDKELLAISSLLFRVFQKNKFADPTYLRWQYFEVPDADAIFANYFEANICQGHYCVVPQTFKRQNNYLRMALSVNTAVDQHARMKGLFTRLAEQTYKRASQEQGIQGIIGVANANSTHGFLSRLKFSLLGSLPVGIGVSFPLSVFSPEVKTFRVNSEFLNSVELNNIIDSLDFEGVRGFSREWGGERLRWRLANPSSNYTFSVSKEGILISAQESIMGIPLAILLKFLPKKGCGEMDVRPLIRSACKESRTALFLYAGYNAAAKVSTIALPSGFKPSPLNLIFRSLDSAALPASQVKFDTFEFLDFDAY